jgi:hypothetical protein
VFGVWLSLPVGNYAVNQLILKALAEPFAATSDEGEVPLHRPTTQIELGYYREPNSDATRSVHEQNHFPAKTKPTSMLSQRYAARRTTVDELVLLLQYEAEQWDTRQCRPTLFSMGILVTSAPLVLTAF